VFRGSCNRIELEATILHPVTTSAELLSSRVGRRASQEARSTPVYGVLRRRQQGPSSLLPVRLTDLCLQKSAEMIPLMQEYEEEEEEFIFRTKTKHKDE